MCCCLETRDKHETWSNLISIILTIASIIWDTTEPLLRRGNKSSLQQSVTPHEIWAAHKPQKKTSFNFIWRHPQQLQRASRPPPTWEQHQWSVWITLQVVTVICCKAQHGGPPSTTAHTHTPISKHKRLFQGCLIIWEKNISPWEECATCGLHAVKRFLWKSFDFSLCYSHNAAKASNLVDSEEPRIITI